MTKSLKLLIFSTFMISVACTAPNGNGIVSSESLLNEMIDREALAVYPSPDYNLKHFSSYDRGAISKKEGDWYANWDCNAFLYEEDNNGRHEYVMMDAEGPGAIVRFWMTFAGDNAERGKGTLRIYVDDMDEPAICGAGFDVISGGLLADAPLSESVSHLTEYEVRGHNLYYPIVFSKRCKVTYETKWLHRDDNLLEWVYYNIDYRQYAPETPVEPFSRETLEKNASLSAQINATLSEGIDKFCEKGTRSEEFEVSILPGESASLKIRGPRAITRLEAMLDAADKGQALRSTVVEMVFDGNSTVWCPFGDFIGTGYRDLYTSTWMTRAEEGLCTSLWVMPFKKECELILHNLGDQTVCLKNGKVFTKSWKWNDRSMYFGTNWTLHYRRPAGDGSGQYSPKDLTFTNLEGKGVYVGDALALYDPTSGWWGEGDEKIYVDGETFPSTFGTGTEDYYGYACCRSAVFTGHPFIAQPCGEGDLAPGYTSNSRYRILDKVPFRTSLDFDMELWHWGDTFITYAPTSFWYILPGGNCRTPRDIEGAGKRIVTE